MTQKNQIDFKKITGYFLRIFNSLTERLFLSYVVLILISLLIGLAFFYKYNILPQRVEPELSPVIKFEERIYRQVLDEWQSRGERFELAKTKKYPGLFR